MTGMSEHLEVVRQWVEKAEHDLLNIRNNLAASDIPWDTVCFHAQQCAEKYVKALLVCRRVEVPRTHDLRLLLQRVPADLLLAVDVSRVLRLNRYTIEARYPGDWEPITPQEGESAVAITQEVCAAVKYHLPSELQ